MAVHVLAKERFYIIHLRVLSIFRQYAPASMLQWAMWHA